MTTNESTARPASGLEGVVVADTRLSDVDGEAGRLVIGGVAVEELAGSSTFEEACALLWDGAPPCETRRETLRAALARGRLHAFERLSSLGSALDAADGMDALRAAAAHLVVDERDEVDAAGLVTGALATFASAWQRRRCGLAPVSPDPARAHADDFLRMALGEPAGQARVEALDAYLVTVVDHGMNASTFTARVIASTRSDLVSAIVGAIGALKGPLHGGAPGPVLDMLDEIVAPARATAWLEAQLAAGRRVMGMGHRIYRVRDPRAFVLERAVARLEAGGVAAERLALARAVERAAEELLAARHPDRPLRANVEFYTAVLLDAVGLPRALFSPTFAAGRVAGWCAHVFEQRSTGRLVRPSSRYVGAPAPRDAA
jgi:citrate synthase